MKITKSFIISLFCIFFTFLMLFILKGVPVSRIWNSFTVLYVDKTVEEDLVLSYLEKNGCTGIISMNQQKVPFYSEFVPVLPVSQNVYLEKRLSYFSDKSNSYRLYYVPRTFDGQAVRALDQLTKDKGIVAGVDGKQQYPWIVPVVALFVYVMFILLSENRHAFAVPAFFPLCFSFSQVFYPAAAVSVLYMLALYLSQRVWMRKKGYNAVSKNIYVIICLASSVTVAFFMGWRSALSLVCCLFSSASSLLFLYEAERIWNSRNSFSYTKIFQAPQLPLMYPKTAFHTLLCLFPLVVILVFFLFSARFTSSKNERNITLPVPVAPGFISDYELPSLEDFQKWVWNVQTFPYRKLNEVQFDVYDGYSVKIPRYQENENGIIYGESSILTYDQKFRDKVNVDIDKLGSAAIENLLKKQGSDTKVVYSNVRNTQQSDGFSLILILFCLFIPVVLLILYSIKAGKAKR